MKQDEKLLGNLRLAVAGYWMLGFGWGWFFMKLPDAWFFVLLLVSSIICGLGGLQMYEPPSKEERRAARKEYMMQCPSAPHACTGECHTAEHAQRVEEILKKEFND